MTESEIIKLVKETIKQTLAPILMGTIVSNEDVNRSTVKHFANSGPIPKARNIQPFGVASRAPAGTQGLIVPIAGDITHLNLVGHFDDGRPAVENGELCLYNQFGQQIYLESGKIHIGKKTTSNPAPVGNELKSFLLDLVAWLETHTHVITLPGLDSLPPTEVADLTAIKAANLDNDNILSDYIFVEKTP